MKNILQLYIEGNRIDLFDDESVNIIQSIQNVKDISKIFVAFSRTFNVPASKVNNKVFKHYYNYSIVDGFDARLKKDSLLELNSRPFKTGKIKLNGVDLKEGVPNNYRITFFGDTIDLNDLLGDDNLSSLELSDFDTTYNASTVKDRLKGVGTSITYSHPDRTTDVVYPAGIIAPLISHTTRLYYQDADSTDYPDSNGGNLYPKSTSHQGVYYGELKYAIKIDAIIKAIEDKYGLTFSTDFFNTTNTPYYNLYLWMNRKKGEVFEDTQVEKRISNFLIDYNQELPIVTSYGDRITVANATSQVQFSVSIQANAAFTGTIYIKENGITRDDLSINVTNSTQGTITGYMSNGTYEVWVKSAESSITFNTNSQWDLDALQYPDGSATYQMQSGGYVFNNTRTFIISEQMPEMKVIDFLTGIFNAFNLTAYTDNNTIIVKTLNDYYEDSTTVWDITSYLDTSESSVNKALPYKEIEFKYSGLDTKLAKQHEQISNISWGTEEYSGDDYYDSSSETYTIEIPFEHMKYERLTGSDIQVGWFVDDNNEPYFGNPLLFYAYKQTTSTTIRFLETENVGTYDDITDYYIPSNSVDIDPTETEVNINFKNELNEYTNTNDFENTLFKVYYQDYITKVFKENRRLTIVYAYLPIKILQEFILADIIAIFDRNYNINQIETDFTTGRSRIELLNEITSSIGGSTPVEPTTTDPNECLECSADSTLCTVDKLTPTADKTCDIGRSVTIAGLTTAEQNTDIDLEATPNNFIGTPSYLWSGGDAAGETTSEVTVNESSTGNVTYTCDVTDGSDSAVFSDSHIVLWTPKFYTITLSITNQIQGPPAGYNITGNQTGDTQVLIEGSTYSFNTNVSANAGYTFSTLPVISNATGTVATSNQTVYTILTGSIQLSQSYITIYGPTQQTINSDAHLTTVATGITPTAYQWSRSTDGGSTYTNVSGETNSQFDANESSAGTYWYKITASDSTDTVEDVHEVIFTTSSLITLTLNVDTSNISASGYSPVANGFTLGGNQTGDTLTQNSGTVFLFNTTISLNAGFEWVGSPTSVNNAGGTYTTSQTVDTTFTTATIQLIVYNYYVVTGCAGESVAGDTKYVRTRDTFTVGTSATGSYVTIDNQCWYTSSTAFETDWATNNGITIGNKEGTGCATCTNVTTTDPCLNTKSLFYLRYSTQNDVCENEQSKGYYYVDGASVSQSLTNFCNRTNIYTYNDCTVNAPAGYYSLDSDNTERRYWNGSSFSTCVTCIDANGLFYLGQGWNPANQYCDWSGRVFGYYYFDNNATLITATSNDHMYTSATNVGTPNRALEGFYTDGTNYRYYEPPSLQVWDPYGTCPPTPTTSPCNTIPTKPTLTNWMQYVDCATGLDQTLVVGHNASTGFPAVIQVNTSGECFKNPTVVSGAQSDGWINGQTCVSNTPVDDYNHYNDCTSCTGTTTTLPPATTTVRPDNVFVMERQSDGFSTYVQLDQTHQVGDVNLTISTGGGDCYDIQGVASVPTPTNYGTITGTCTTTTTTTTTTTIACGSQLLYKSSVDALTACCNTTVAKLVYMDSNSITTATAIYTSDTCGTLLGTTTFFTDDFSNYYQWNATTNSLTGPTTCPSCP